VPARGGRPVYQCGEWEVDLARQELRARGKWISIGSRAFEIFEVLVQTAGELVTKEDLMERVWPGAVVEDNTLQVHISAVRKALGRDRDMLKTASGRGYRLVGNWTMRLESAIASPVDPEPTQAPETAPSTNLPAAASELIGRSAAVSKLRDLLSAYRVVTLCGPGGIGKTALALEVARDQLTNFSAEVRLVELVSLSDPGLLPSVVASALGLNSAGDAISAEAVARAIGTKSMLLVFDNCEHVVDAAARLVEAIARACPRTTVLATSREVLRIEGEHVYRVAPLDVPSERYEERDDVLGRSAAQLFVARTAALRSDFSPGDEDLSAIASICRRLDGIPLAIEFAAARAATLGVREIASRLDDRFGLLTGGRRTALARHQTLRATLDWSYELLPESERRLLRRLAVFAGGFTLEAAAAVTNDAGNAPSVVVEGIANLVAKSLVTLDGSAAAERWRLLETIRAYALEKLVESGEIAQAGRRHAEYFRDIFAPTASRSLLQPAIADMARYGREIDNVRAALGWAFSPVGDPTVGVILTAGYLPVWLHFVLQSECRERIERALDSLGSELDLNPQLQMQLHLALGLSLIYTLGSVDRTRTTLAKALEIAEILDDVDAQLRAHWALWILSLNVGECRAAQSASEQFSRVALRTGDKAAVIFADRLAGTALQYVGQLGEAQLHLERVLEFYVAPEDKRHTIWLQFDQLVMARAMLARVLWLRGCVDQAVYQAQASLEGAQAKEYRVSICEALRLAVYPVTVMTGDYLAAERAVTKLIDIAAINGAPFWGLLGRCLRGTLLIRRGEFGTGAALLRSALDACERTGWMVWYTEFLGVLAEGMAGLRRLNEAHTTVDKAIAWAERGGELWYVAELFRNKGEFLLQGGEDHAISAAEDCFRRALEVARGQGALFWELRAALSLARLKSSQGRPNDAREALEMLCQRYPAGLETPDLRSARAMLDSLPSRGPGLGR